MPVCLTHSTSTKVCNTHTKYIFHIKIGLFVVSTPLEFANTWLECGPLSNYFTRYIRIYFWRTFLEWKFKTKINKFQHFPQSSTATLSLRTSSHLIIPCCAFAPVLNWRSFYHLTAYTYISFIYISAYFGP